MLDKDTLKAAIKQAFTDQRDKTDNWEQALDDLSTKISTAVDAYVKSATIVYTNGLICPTGAVTGAFNGKLT